MSQEVIQLGGSMPGCCVGLKWLWGRAVCGESPSENWPDMLPLSPTHVPMHVTCDRARWRNRTAKGPRVFGPSWCPVLAFKPRLWLNCVWGREGGGSMGVDRRVCAPSGALLCPTHCSRRLLPGPLGRENPAQLSEGRG